MAMEQIDSADGAGETRRQRAARARRERREAQRLRLGVQFFFLALVALLIWEYHRFVQAALHGAPVLPARPSGAEGFLPIAALVSLVHLLQTGQFDPVHPAALAILLAAVASAFLLRKAFCSWVCPVGALSEWTAALGKWCWGRNFRMPRWLDKPLLGLKYVLLGFFLFGVVRMGDYYYYEFDRYADVGMYGYWFWGRVGPAMILFAVVMVIWGLFVQAPWCRYLCPYGALLGIVSRFSPARITRNAESCIDCGRCAARCPAGIPVDQLANVQNAECTSCLQCTSACPVPETLDLRLTGRRVAPRRFALLAVSLFFAVILLAMLSGHWRTNIPAAEYRHAIPALRQGPGMPHRF